MNTLFDTAEFSVKTPQVENKQFRSIDGQYCTKQTVKAVDRLRTCLVGEVRRRDSFWRQMRMKDEEILALKAKLRNFEEINHFGNMF